MIDLENLNEIVYEDILNKSDFPQIDYELLKHVLIRMLKESRIEPMSTIKHVTLLTKEEAIKIALEFFKSIDEDFYNKAVKIIMQQDKNTIMKLYNIDDDINLGEREDNMAKYTEDGSIQTYGTKSSITVPLQRDILDVKDELSYTEKISLEDLYAIVHEISHTFDLNRDNMDYTRDILTEVTPFCFERMLDDFLVNKKGYSSEIINGIAQRRRQQCLSDAKLVIERLELSEYKEKNGKITKEYLEEQRKEKNFTYQEFQSILERTDLLDMRKRYPIAALIVPHIIKQYKTDRENTINKLKEYFNKIEDNDFLGALAIFDINLSEDSISKLIIEMNQKYGELIFNKENKEER